MTNRTINQKRSLPMTRHYDDDFENNVLKDQRSVRVSMQARDAAMAKHTPLIVDGRGNSGLALHKPGFRIATDDTGKSRVADAYRDYETSLVEAYRATGEQPESKSQSTGYSGIKSDAQMREHKQNMARLYAQRDAELSQAWRNNG